MLRDDAYKTGELILKALDKLNFVHVNKDGQTQHVLLERVKYNDTHNLAAYTVNTTMLPRGVNLTSMMRDNVLNHLAAVVHRPVTLAPEKGLTYVVHFAPPVAPTRARLPKKALFHFHHCPTTLEYAVPLGVDRRGHNWQSLERLGHILASGMSGYGKSTWFQVALASLLTIYSPKELQLALIDPKDGLEFSLWHHSPHLLAPVAIKRDDAYALIVRLQSEMAERGERIKALGCRGWSEYRRLDKTMPPLIVCIDEAAALAKAAGPKSNFVSGLEQLTMTARAYGIYLWIVAQVPKWDILPSTIKGNLTTTLVFRCRDAAMARTCGIAEAAHINPDLKGRYWVDYGEGNTEIQGYWIEPTLLQGAAKGVGWKALDKPQGPRLNAEERLACEIARDELGGRFVINKIVEGSKARGRALSQRRLVKLGQDWQTRGWLAYYDGDKAKGRYMTPELLDLLKR